MRSIACLAFLTLSTVALPVAAQTRTRVQEWGYDVVVLPRPHTRPDDFVLQFRVEAGRGTLVGRSPSLYGPVLVSGPNGEIFSCEGNGATQGEGAIVFDRNGRVQAHVEHIGALKACGISANRRLYWLHYVLAERGHTYSLVRIIGAGGLVHGERRLDEAGTAHFRDDDGQAYTFDIGPPTLPAGYAIAR